MLELGDLSIRELARQDTSQSPWRRFRVLACVLLAGGIVSFLLALFFNVEKGFPGTAWMVILAGPLNARAFFPFSWAIPLGWLGLVLVWAHPIRPHVITGVATALGLALWLFAGWLIYMVGAWGA